MRYRSMGRSGLMVSSVGLGANNFGRKYTATETKQGSAEVINSAIENGINFIDTADIYGGYSGQSEEIIGDIIQGRRDEVLIATKWGHSDFTPEIHNWGARGSRTYVRKSLEASLKRLKTDYVDLYQMHTPDAQTPVEETLTVLNDLIDEGKIRYIGHSNFKSWQISHAELSNNWKSRFISAQDEYSILNRKVEEEIFGAIDQYEIGFIPYFPLYNGILTGKFTRNSKPSESRIMKQKQHILDEISWNKLEKYQKFCNEYGKSMTHMSFLWLLSHDQVSTVIAGATSSNQVIDNAVAGDLDLFGTEEIEIINGIFSGE